MIPVRCDTTRKKFAPVTIFLIVACCAVYGAQMRWDFFSKGLIPLKLTYSIFHPGPATVNSIAMVALAFFMHAGLFHLLSNMWYLWIFGTALESRINAFHFIFMYIVCGAVSMLSQAAYSPLSCVGVVGASGAIAGIMGVYFITMPFSRILVWIPPIFFIRVPAFIFLLIWFYVQYANASTVRNAGVAWWAHIGGFVTGICWGVYFLLHSSNNSKKQQKK